MISVIMPVYNAGLFLNNSISSVFNQTYNDWELIIVDDNSTDNSYSIAKSFSEKDCRVKLLRSNQTYGPAKSRNLGFEHASGEFVVFIDSDDSYEAEFLKKMDENIKQFNADIVWCQHYIVINNIKSKIDNKIEKGVLFNNRKAIEILFENQPGVASLWNKIFRKSFIDKWNLRLNEKRSRGEDLEFIIDAFQKADKIVCIEDYLYNYIRQNVNSVIVSYRPNDLPLMIETIKKYRKLSSEFNMRPHKKFYGVHAKSILEQLYSTSKYDKNEAKNAIQMIKESEDFQWALTEITKDNTPLSYRIFARLMNIHYSLAIAFARLR